MVRKYLLVVLVLMVSGCAIFEGGQVPTTTLIPVTDSGIPKPTVSYSLQASGGLSKPKEFPEAARSRLEGELLSVLEASGNFSRISKQDETADIKLAVMLTNRGNPAAMIPAVITGLSLYVIPSWATDHFDLVAKVERRDGLRKEYTLSDTTRIVQWLPMLFVFPAKNFSVVTDVRKNMHRKVIADMRSDGFFDASVATSAPDDNSN